MSGWQPIETAPKDETDILGWCSYTSGDFYVFQVFFDPGSGNWIESAADKSAKDRQYPTHWMPVPAPPEEY